MKACLESTDWDVLTGGENADVLASYILFCESTSVHYKTVKVFPFKRVNVNKACGTDQISGKILKTSAKSLFWYIVRSLSSHLLIMKYRYQQVGRLPPSVLYPKSLGTVTSETFDTFVSRLVL